MVHSHKDMSDVATSYFNNLFQTKNNCNSFMYIIIIFHFCISSYDNDSLLAPFSMEEFHLALFEMNSDKSPGYDGLNSASYK